MPFDDLRAFLAALDADGDLQRIEVPVDREWEIGAICREVCDRYGPALKFERVGQFRTPLVVGALATRRRYARALDAEPNCAAIADRWREAYASPLSPERVSSAPCQEVVRETVDFFEDPFPVPRWHHRDGRYMLGTFHGVITQDPDTGWINVGTYRSAIYEPNILGCAFEARKHIWQHWNKYRERGEPLPVAVAIGLDPYLGLTTVSPVPPGQDDYTVAGGLKGAPIEVVRAQTSDLLVPARAEIVIEGEIPTDQEYGASDGPFGEFAGYMGESIRFPHHIVAKLVTHRRDPLFQGIYEGRPPNESTTIRGIGGSMSLKEHLRRSGVPGVMDVCVTDGGCGGFHAVVSIKKAYQGQVRDIFGLALGLPNMVVKQCVVVDDDVDPWNSQQVEWAIATRVQASRDIEILRRGRSSPLDPSKTPSQGWQSDKMGIDATRPEFEYSLENAQFPASADPTPEHLDRVRARWAEYGFGRREVAVR
jgi:2,5-furandicarboxylate decarboxylase 1